MRLKSRLSEADTGPLVLTSNKEAKYYQAVLQPPEYESKQLQTCRESVLLCGSNFEHCWKSTDQWTMRCHRRMTDVSTRLTLLAGFILTVGLTLSLGSNQHVGFTFLLPAGSTECFFQTTARDDTMEVEYQVIAGSGLDVGFALISPSGYRLVSDFRRSDGIHMVEPTEDGDYRLCFDNSFSKLSEKMVFFEVIINSQSSESRGLDEWADLATTESLEGYQLEDVRARMDAVHQHLERSRQVQTALRAFEARDRYLLEDNLWRVSFWSCLNLLVMLTVAVTQIYTLRRLFDDTRRICT